MRVSLTVTCTALVLRKKTEMHPTPHTPFNSFNHVTRHYFVVWHIREINVICPIRYLFFKYKRTVEIQPVIHLHTENKNK